MKSTTTTEPDYASLYIELRARVLAAEARASQAGAAEGFRQAVAEVTSEAPIYGLDVATPNACPAWCTEPAGHGYDILDDDAQLQRYHEGFYDTFRTADLNEYGNPHEISVGVCVLETATPGVAPNARFAKPELRLSASSVVELTSKEARRLAAGLVRAANQLDELEKPQEGTSSPGALLETFDRLTDHRFAPGCAEGL